jgi:hypothetical protein
MGQGMAKNILGKGFPLTVLAHRNRQPVEELLAKGAEKARNAAELARVPAASVRRARRNQRRPGPRLMIGEAAP